MTNSDILMFETCEIPVKLSHQCVTENGIFPDEEYTIKEVIGAFEQVRIANQYGQELIINPNQLEGRLKPLKS